MRLQEESRDETNAEMGTEGWLAADKQEAEKHIVTII